MYWIYLTIFIFIVFVPTSINSGFYFLSATQVQELAILVLGSIGFGLFLMLEKLYNKNLVEKNKIQGRVNSMSKDLKYSYSYIGEINRKLDILENIALGYPESSKLTPQGKTELFDDIMQAIRLFAKSNDFSLRFVQLQDYALIKEFKNNQEIEIDFSFKGREFGISHFEFKNFIIITSPRAIDNIFSYIVIKKSGASQRIEDIEIMKTIASQALFVFVFMRNKRQIKCVI
ncbi:MAG: hypothetical protein WCI36_03970 [bacterium]